MHACETIVDIVLWEHDLIDAREQFRLVPPHPQELWRGKSRKGDIRRPCAELFPADALVEVIDLIRRAPVVPENRGTDHPIRRVKHDETVHLPARADPRYPRGIVSAEKFRYPRLYRLPPCRRILLAPSGLRKIDRIAARHNIFNISRLVRQQQLTCGRAEIDTDVKHHITLLVAAYAFAD